MLQQILEQGFIEPELLAELDEDQKQLLFCKLREEQVKKWTEAEEAYEHGGVKKSKSANRKGRSVGFLKGGDGNDWVWVMGEHENDKSIEQILEDEQLKIAAKEAEEETKRLLAAQEEELKRIQADQEKLEREQEELRKQEEEYQTLKEIRLAKQLEADRIAKEQEKEKLISIKKARVIRRQQSVDDFNKIKDRRSTEIFSTIRERRLIFEQEAHKTEPLIEKEWRQQEERAKQKEKEIREVARRARAEHRLSLREKLKANTHLIGKTMIALKDAKNNAGTEIEQVSVLAANCVDSTNQPALTRTRSARPPNRDAIVGWWISTEAKRGSGREPKTNVIATWFHGLISRQQAEDLLQGQPVGSFLVRVSERIWGYAVSYRAGDRCKHFLIDTDSNKYQFFGTNQISHDSLASLISHHKAND